MAEPRPIVVVDLPETKFAWIQVICSQCRVLITEHPFDGSETEAQAGQMGAQDVAAWQQHLRAKHGWYALFDWLEHP